MDTSAIVVAVLVLIALVAIARMVALRRRTQGLKSRFGPEYDRTVRERGSQAESALLHRQERVEKFPIRELSASERERFVTEWRQVQSRFVDDPRRSVSDADMLVTRVME